MYKTGDGYKFPTMLLAVDHANRIHAQTGVYVSVVEVTPLSEAHVEPFTDYKGRVYAEFEARRVYVGKGWEVVGIAQNVSARVVTAIAWPFNAYRKARGFNGEVKHGWKTKREAQIVADALNAAK